MDSRLDKNGLISDINVTPFVDVMLVLLIIFMVTAPMMVHGLKADLPKADSRALPSEKEHIIVTIDKDSNIFINSFEVNLGFLKEKLIKVLENHTSKNVYLIADKNIAYGTVVLVMAQIKGAGVSSVGLVTDSTKNDKT